MNNTVTENSYCIFQEPWWLDAVVPGGWGEVQVKRGDEVVARLPWTRARKHGFVSLGMPQLTKALGPWMIGQRAKQAEWLAFQKEVLAEAIAQLPSFDYFHQTFCPEFTNAYPFFLAGFDTTVRYTYRLDNLADLDAVYAGFRSHIRRHIRKAGETVTIRDDLGIEALLRLIDMTYSRQGRKAPYDADLVRRVHAAAAERGVGKLLFAEDVKGRLHGAIYLVSDGRITYWLMSGADPGLRNSGATSLLVWNGIQWGAARAPIFDFEGSMVEPIEKFISAFGGRQVQYLSVRKMSPRLRLLNAGREMVNAVRLSVARNHRGQNGHGPQTPQEG